VVVQQLANRVCSTFSDTYGRFSEHSLVGKAIKTISVITAYQVVEGNAGTLSAQAQQRAMLVTKGRLAQPRKLFLQDLQEHILANQEKGRSIILGLDANKSFTRKPSGIRKLVEACGPVDVHAKKYPTEKWASHRRGSYPIDFLYLQM
jgi:hypothetical protein